LGDVVGELWWMELGCSVGMEFGISVVWWLLRYRLLVVKCASKWERYRSDIDEFGIRWSLERGSIRGCAMITYAEVNGTTLVQYPFGLSQLQAENPYTIYPANVNIPAIYPQTDYAKKSGNSLVAVTIATPPNYNPATQICFPAASPILIAGIWTLGWVVTNMTPAQIQSVEAATLASVLAQGCVVSSASAPALNGTYGCAPQDQSNLTVIILGIADQQGLPGGGSTFAYLDAVSVPHTFTATQFTELAVAIRNYVYAATIAILGGSPPPSNALSIP
jgi:hypothetical protein